MTDHYFQAGDGTRLYARVEGIESGLTPLLCLPGLTRNSADFDPVFGRYARLRQVIGMDFRGRGRSAQAMDPASYRPDVELQDTLAFLDHLGIGRVAVLGTSRGGIVGLVMAATAPQRLAGLCLNDIGCKLETDGLLRIMSYVGADRRYANWDEAALAFGWSASGFDNVPFEQWQAVVRRIYRETADGIVHNHDLALGQSLPAEQDVRDGKVPELWALLPACATLPFAVLRGAGSDLLSAETVTRMQAEAPDLSTTTIPDRGHVPFLDEPESNAALDAWLAEVDENEIGRT